MQPSMEDIVRETIQQVNVAKSTAGLLASTGVYGYDLSGLVSLVPVNTPARNNVSAFPRRIATEGNPTAAWRALLNINASQPNPAVGFDAAGPIVQLDEQDCFAPYVPLAMGGVVTLDAVALARNFADALAVDELQTLIQLFIGQDIFIINGQSWAVPVPGTPTVTTSTTGGSIGHAVNVYVKCAARSGTNYYYGGSTAASAEGTQVSGSSTTTNSFTASVSAVKGAVAYDWFIHTTTGDEVYYTTTTTSSVLITSVPDAQQPLPNLPLLSTVHPNAFPTTDTSFSADWYNGVIASTLGDYGTNGPVQPGSGVGTGAVWIDNGGAALQLSGGGITLLDQINADLWATTLLSPNAYMVNSLQGDEISKLLKGSSAATTFLPPTDADARTNLAGGGFVGRYVNSAAGGVAIPIEVHPHVPPGTIIARTDHVPYPGSNIGTVFEVRCQYDTMRFDYAANRADGAGGGPRFDYETRSMETLVNRAPGAQAIACNIG